MPSATLANDVAAITAGFIYGTAGMLTNAQQLFTTFGLPVLGYAGGIALFMGLFQAIANAIRAMRG
jgi:hypothetical protein